MDRKFLTVMAVLDDETQHVMQKMQSDIIGRYGAGTQTMGIPFHISLGSYPTEDTDALVERIIATARNTPPFEVDFDGLGHFGGKVIFMQPKINDKLRVLHELFDNNFADGFDWYAHATLFCCHEGQSIDVSGCGFVKAYELKKAKIIGVELGEFFPAKEIIYSPLEGE